MKKELLERFLKYVQIYTPSNEDGDTAPNAEAGETSANCEVKTPSTACQFDLANVLADEMKAMGITDAHVDEHCYVYGHIPATPGCEGAPKVGFLSHMDTVSDFCSKPTTPLVHENYDGTDIYLPAGGRTIAISDYPHLEKMKGRTIITSDGTTILGADDKAGVAEIMTMAEAILNSDQPHGTICIGFTPDEEIGSGAELLDLEKFGADFAYTVDGDLEGKIEYETFNAAGAKLEIRGVNVHPGSAKDIMVNAAAVGSEFDSMLPANEQPRTTSGYEGFFHLIEFTGTVEKATLKYIIRDHDRQKFEERKKRFEDQVRQLNEKYGEGTITLAMKDTYYNMAEILKDHMELIFHARAAAAEAGIEPRTNPVRGGTDGSRLSFRGLPCPNLGTGGSAFHGPYEHISLEGMEKTVQLLVNLIYGFIKEEN